MSHSSALVSSTPLQAIPPEVLADNRRIP